MALARRCAPLVTLSYHQLDSRARSVPLVRSSASSAGRAEASAHPGPLLLPAWTLETMDERYGVDQSQNIQDTQWIEV